MDAHDNESGLASFAPERPPWPHCSRKPVRSSLVAASWVPRSVQDVLTSPDLERSSVADFSRKPLRCGAADARRRMRRSSSAHGDIHPARCAPDGSGPPPRTRQRLRTQCARISNAQMPNTTTRAVIAYRPRRMISSLFMPSPTGTGTGHPVQGSKHRACHRSRRIETNRKQVTCVTFLCDRSLIAA